jgi:hypothetical protein
VLLGKIEALRIPLPEGLVELKPFHDGEVRAQELAGEERLASLD